jgi:hypothetical protein
MQFNLTNKITYASSACLESILATSVACQPDIRQPSIPTSTLQNLVVAQPQHGVPHQGPKHQPPPTNSTAQCITPGKPTPGGADTNAGSIRPKRSCAMPAVDRDPGSLHGTGEKMLSPDTPSTCPGACIHAYMSHAFPAKCHTTLPQAVRCECTAGDLNQKSIRTSHTLRHPKNFGAPARPALLELASFIQHHWAPWMHSLCHSAASDKASRD